MPCYVGKVFTNVFVAFFAMDKDRADVTSLEAEFQSLIASVTQVFLLDWFGARNDFSTLTTCSCHDTVQQHF